MFLRTGWRNIWRNPKRTLVITTAIVIGVWNMIFLGAFMRGIAAEMVRNGIDTLTGHIQVQHQGYRNDPVVENSIPNPLPLVAAIEKSIPPDSRWTSRIRVNAVISNARHSAGVTLVGIDPIKEEKLSFIGRAVSEGHYLQPGNDTGIVIGKALAEKFETGLGRKMVLMSQNTEKEIASQAFRINGIFQAEMEATEKQFVFVTLAAAQTMLGLSKEISEISILLPRAQADQAAELKDTLISVLSSEDIEVHTWRELLPLVSSYLKIYDGFILLWFVVVFVAMGFGIVNTTLMAVFERIREFGLLKALGMKPSWIVRQVLTEAFYILLLGLIIGNALGFLTVSLFFKEGIDLSAFAAGMEFAGLSRIIYPVIEIRDVLEANLVVCVLGIIVNLYPALKAARFTPVEALTHT